LSAHLSICPKAGNPVLDVNRRPTDLPREISKPISASQLRNRIIVSEIGDVHCRPKRMFVGDEAQ
jgi:hypothetical protein